MNADLEAWLQGPVRSYLVSQAYGMQTMLVSAGAIGWALGPSNGGYNDWPSFVTFASHAWFGILIGFLFGVGPFVRARQAVVAATKVVSTPTYISTPVTPSPPAKP